MALVITYDQFTNYRTCKPRDEPDLPEEVVGTAFWVKPGPSQNGHEVPPSYHVKIDEQYYPIEFVNKQWHYLEWDDSPRHTGYWVRPTKAIKHGDLGLGFIGEPTEAKTPTNLGQIRERAESSSTQPVEEEKPEEEEEDAMDKNPQRTEALAEDLYQRSIIFGADFEEATQD